MPRTTPKIEAWNGTDACTFMKRNLRKRTQHVLNVPTCERIFRRDRFVGDVSHVVWTVCEDKVHFFCHTLSNCQLVRLFLVAKIAIVIMGNTPLCVANSLSIFCFASSCKEKDSAAQTSSINSLSLKYGCGFDDANLSAVFSSRQMYKSAQEVFSCAEILHRNHEALSSCCLEEELVIREHCSREVYLFESCPLLSSFVTFFVIVSNEEGWVRSITRRFNGCVLRISNRLAMLFGSVTYNMRSEPTNFLYLFISAQFDPCVCKALSPMYWRVRNARYPLQ